LGDRRAVDLAARGSHGEGGDSTARTSAFSGKPVSGGDHKRRQPGENTLEITSPTLAERLIGDQSLPPEERTTWTTWNPYTKDSPLLDPACWAGSL
jgi:hypothetical protein